MTRCLVALLPLLLVAQACVRATESEGATVTVDGAAQR